MDTRFPDALTYTAAVERAASAVVSAVHTGLVANATEFDARVTAEVEENVGCIDERTAIACLLFSHDPHAGVFLLGTDHDDDPDRVPFTQLAYMAFEVDVRHAMRCRGCLALAG